MGTLEQLLAEVRRYERTAKCEEIKGHANGERICPACKERP